MHIGRYENISFWNFGPHECILVMNHDLSLFRRLAVEDNWECSGIYGVYILTWSTMKLWTLLTWPIMVVKVNVGIEGSNEPKCDE